VFPAKQDAEGTAMIGRVFGHRLQLPEVKALS